MEIIENNPQAEEPSQPADTLPLATWEALPDKLRQAASNAGWTELMPVQAKAIPYLFAQQDTMIQSRTGSGKTGAYLLPMLEMLNPLAHHPGAGAGAHARAGAAGDA
jgi:ATP-dependent RNA helicase DeaD